MTIEQLEMKHIAKSFESFQALQDVSFTVKKGEIHALLGANGAGKSTLMKILSGAYSEYTGTIYKNGHSVTLGSPKDAKNLGIAIVHQEVDVALVPSLTVAENIVLDRQTSKGSPAIVKWKQHDTEAKKALAMLGSTLNVKKNVSELTLAEKQQVLLARAILQDAEYIILDEPTAPLSQHETKRLFEVVTNLKKKGMGIIYISHRLQEVSDLCDVYTVLKDGKHVVTKAIVQSTMQEMITFMLGKQVAQESVREEVAVGTELLRVEKLSLPNVLQDITFHVKEGEVVGIAGLVGAGKTELCRSLFGLENKTAGQLSMRNHPLLVNRSPRYYIKNKLSLIPEERRKEGILVDESIVLNLSLPSLKDFTKWSFVQKRKQKEASQSVTANVGVKASSVEQKVKTLSGGNQQKVAIGKWLLKETDVYIFDEPTKGIDIGSKQEIFSIMNELTKQQKGILYATCEFDELVNMADRIYVMYNGKIVKELSKAEATYEQLFYYASGGTV